MPFGRWIRLSVFALLAVAAAILLGGALTDIQRTYTERQRDAAIKTAAQEEITTAHIANECLSLESFARVICVGEALKAKHETERVEDDLTAQTLMAVAATWLLIVTGAQLIISLGGIYYVARSLDKSVEAVTLTKQALIADNRPWVKVTAELDGAFKVSDTNVSCSVAISLNNVGNAPALDVGVWCAIFDARDAEFEYEIAGWVEEAMEAHKSKTQIGEAIFPAENVARSYGAIMSPSTLADARNREEPMLYPKLAVVVNYRIPAEPKDLHQTLRVFSCTFRSAGETHSFLYAKTTHLIPPPFAAVQPDGQYGYAH